MDWREILAGIIWTIITFAVIFVLLAETVSFEFAVMIFLICAIIGLAGIIDGLKRK